jgi:hypothetical protein
MLLLDIVRNQESSDSVLYCCESDEKTTLLENTCEARLTFLLRQKLRHSERPLKHDSI